MLTLHIVPEADGTQSVSYGGVGMNASEGIHHKDTVINVKTLRESDIGLEVELMINSLRSTSQDFCTLMTVHRRSLTQWIHG